MARDQHAGHRDRIEVITAEAADDYRAGIADVGLGHLILCEGLGNRNRAVEIIGMGGAEAGNGAACLRP